MRGTNLFFYLPLLLLLLQFRIDGNQLRRLLLMNMHNAHIASNVPVKLLMNKWCVRFDISQLPILSLHIAYRTISNSVDININWGMQRNVLTVILLDSKKIKAPQLHINNYLFSIFLLCKKTSVRSLDTLWTLDTTQTIITIFIKCNLISIQWTSIVYVRYYISKINLHDATRHRFGSTGSRWRVVSIEKLPVSQH